MQTRLGSFFESFLNIGIGYVLAVATQIVVFPLFDMHPDFHENLLIGLVFMVVSLARSYALRRIFNWVTIRRMNRVSPKST